MRSFFFFVFVLTFFPRSLFLVIYLDYNLLGAILEGLAEISHQLEGICLIKVMHWLFFFFTVHLFITLPIIQMAELVPLCYFGV